MKKVVLINVATWMEWTNCLEDINYKIRSEKESLEQGTLGTIEDGGSVWKTHWIKLKHTHKF